MTLTFDAAALESHINSEIALQAMQDAFAAESRNATKLPPRIDTPTGRGFLRVMPAVLEDVMGLKVMTLVNGVGNRYLVLLYDVATGALLAMFDADELTRVRTAAVTALAARYLCDEKMNTIGIIGTGFEAVGHLRFFADLWPLAHVTAYSPNAERREAFARTMSAELHIDVTPVDRPEQAMTGHACVILATKAKTAVIDGSAFDPRSTVLSIGSTRLDLRELDYRTLERASTLLVDDVGAVLHESGDIVDAIAAGAFATDRMTSLSHMSAGAVLNAPSGERDLFVFKSVGTALQDLALARALYRDAEFRARGTDIGDLISLKPFATQGVTLGVVPA